MKQVALAEVKDHLSRYVQDAADEHIVITRHGRATAVLIGFKTEDDWFEYRLQNDPRFLQRIAQARAALRQGKGVAWQKIQAEEDRRASTPKRTKRSKG